MNISKEMKWNSVEVFPLCEVKDGAIFPTPYSKHIGLFLAALQVNDNVTGEKNWDIQLCVITDEMELRAVYDNEIQEPWGWELTDVEYWCEITAPSSFQ